MPRLKRLGFTSATALALIIFNNSSINAADEAPSDSQIVGIVLAADQIDIDYGKIALAESKDEATRAFAERMVTDHSAVQKSVIELAQKLGVQAADSPTSDGLKTGAKEVTAKLHSLRGKEFDKFYIDNEAGYHKTVTDAVDSVLIPNARNAELKAALEGARPLFLAHLEHARSIASGSHMMKPKAMGQGKTSH